VRDVDVKRKIAICDFSEIYPICLLDLKGQNASMETCRGDIFGAKFELKIR